MGKPPAKSPCFFKVMIGNFKTCPGIPPSFMKHIRGKLGTKSILTSHSGRQWHVKARMKDNAFSFHSGWEAFMKDHSIVPGDFLVFLYDRYSGFRCPNLREERV